MKQQKNRRLRLLLLGAAALILLLALVLALVAGAKARADRALVAEGVAFLDALAQKEPSVVDAILRDRREQEIAAQKDALLRALYAGERDVWSLFEDYAVLGDSRAVGFSYYGFLEDSRVLAGSGDTIRKVESHLDELKALNPSSIYLCYGLNDVSIGFWNTPEEYATEMIEVVAMLNRELPDAMVIVSSTLPAIDPAFETSSKWREIPQFNAAVESSCMEHGVIFVSNDKTAADHLDLYAPDGIHLQTGFYDYWGSNLIAAMLEHSGRLEDVGG